MDTLLGWASDESAAGGLYQTTLATFILEYIVILFFGSWLIVEYFYNTYEQQYFGSFNPVFLTIVLMMTSGYGFTRLLSMVKRAVGPTKQSPSEDDY